MTVSVAKDSELDVDNEDYSDYPEEPDLVETAGHSERDEEYDEVFEEVHNRKLDKSRVKTASKERNELAKKYAEQNAKLKLKLKEVKNNYASMLEKNKKKGEEFIKQSENSKAVVEKTVQISTVLDSLQKEREDLSEIRKKNEQKIEGLSQELIEAYGEIDALKMNNEKLQEHLGDLEQRVGHLKIQPDYESLPPLNIPRLDMTDIDNDENGTLHEFSERSVLSNLSEFDHVHLAGALAEIAGAHCERLRMITQS
ncbi:HALZ domain-containing protein [Caenorhabditis elegans]|nr:HALZ domain-containing protein [Caenorhabditis elegans]CTQ87095.1 HALZ domain-containing protein [Caenorhabditis elegans]|eukprot:NP_001300384.1 Uncharacterized protein CELE_Y102A11A.9 [Caenorhabditis elegans]